ncbi:MAG TPA: methyltransferase [Bacteriovoracaceae bacterium]|nr:methyltransferase [Bacteriovoracaceae bacterium]
MNKELKRYPVIKNDPLQAWDSADELILQEISKEDLADKKILIINDAFGALSCGLTDVTSYTDSFVSAKAIALNSRGKITCLSDLNSLNGHYSFVLIKIPKNMSFFEDILCHLTQHLRPGTKIICGAMVKHLSPTSFDLLQKYIGDTTTSLAQKKARLVFASFQKEKVISPYPLKLKIESFPHEFINHSNLFSREKLDIGSRFFLEHIPHGPFKEILDLGCANGIIGIKARELNPSAKIIFSDESYMAIQSAQVNYKKYFSDEAQYCWTNCYEEGVPDSLDLVLCNPPFHQQSTIGDFIAWQMFMDSFSALRPGGLIRVIGNSHLGYQHKLKKIFGNSKVIATNQKFMIIDSRK